MRAKLIGAKEMKRKLRWVRDNIVEIKKYALVKMCVELADLVNNPDDLKFIQVKTAKSIYFGVSLEPPVLLTSYAALENKALYYLPLTALSANYNFGVWVQDGSPWVVDHVPVEVGRMKDEGFFYTRDINKSEVDAIAELNLKYLESKRTIISGGDRARIMRSDEVYTCEDVAYNQARAEFGIGDSASPTWRPALRQLIRERIQDILDDVLDAIVNQDLSINDLPTFEDRPESWLSDHADFVLTITS